MTSIAATPARSTQPAPAAGDMLVVNDVCAAYGPYRALFNVSFSVPAGGIVALVGSNGAGKSTVARTITGLVTANSGSITLEGRDITKLPAFRIARLGMAHVVEGRGVFSSLTVVTEVGSALSATPPTGPLEPENGLTTTRMATAATTMTRLTTKRARRRFR